MEIIYNDKTVRSDTAEDLKEFNSQSLTTQAKKGEQLFSMMPATKQAFDLMGYDMVELSPENKTLKNFKGDSDQNNWVYQKIFF